MRNRLVFALGLAGLVACARDDDARKLLSDMATLQEGVQSAMHDSPDEAGVSKAEGLAAAQRAPLHARDVDVSSGKLSANVLVQIPTRCAGDAGAAKVGQDYVKSALDLHERELDADREETARRGGEPAPKALRGESCGLEPSAWARQRSRFPGHARTHRLRGPSGAL